MPTRRPAPIAVALLSVAVLGPACARRAPADPHYAAEIEAWRARRLAALTADDGWLTVTGLFWLRPGENRFGSAAGNEIVLPGRETPAVAGTLDLLPDGAVVAHPLAGAGVTLGGGPAGVQRLRSDRDGGTPDVLRIGSVSVYVIDRSGKLAARVKDARNPARLRFKGIESFPIDPAYRVEGTFEPFASPRPVSVASAQGPSQTMLVPGVVRFSAAGTPLALEPFVSSPEDTTFFFVFRDRTAGHETYGAGRFLDADAPAKGSRTVVLDFNKATNPPCAFTPFATCPLPPPANVLPVRIEAGERYSGTH
ncbi:MAG TPA: DUF1684 domain-containing protein [Thermoanaerobaculaceae bacterium]|nr:DUF1684 domain-containing protein [Thermoanaerobaculaceae bacterium]